MGSEIKSIRARHVNLRESYVQPRDGELWLVNAHIAAYDQAGNFGHEPLRRASCCSIARGSIAC